MMKLKEKCHQQEEDYEEIDNDEEEKSTKKYKRKSAEEQREKMEELGIPSFILFTESPNDPDSSKSEDIRIQPFG